MVHSIPNYCSDANDDRSRTNVQAVGFLAPQFEA